MKNNKMAGILFLVLAVAVMVWFCRPWMWWGKQEKGQDIKSQEWHQGEEEDAAGKEGPEKKTGREYSQFLQEETGVYKLPDLTLDIPDEALRILEVDAEKLSDALREYTYYNGYSHAAGASFYHLIEVDFTEMKYTMSLKLVMDEAANQEGDVYLRMEYYKERDEFEFHK